MVLTDLLPNLPLLAANCRANGMPGTSTIGFECTIAADHVCSVFLAAVCFGQQTEYDRIISAAAEVQLAMMQSSHDLPGLLLSVTNPFKKLTDAQIDTLVIMLAIGCKACCTAVPEDASGSVTVKEHRWGERLADFGGPFDVIVACGVLHFLVDLPVSNSDHVHMFNISYGQL